ncbi:MAG TPA: hypothetical protein VGE50_07020 [Gammaproteobacteria bacterium]
MSWLSIKEDGENRSARRFFENLLPEGTVLDDAVYAQWKVCQFYLKSPHPAEE